MDDTEKDHERYLQLQESLTNQTPSEEQIEQIEYIRGVAKRLGLDIIKQCPDTRERSLALTHLEETVMWAVKSIVLDKGD